MVERAILHIGFPKTGTTMIQKWLYENRNSLRATHDIVYPEKFTRHRWAHQKLSRIFHPNSNDNLELISQCVLTEADGAGTVILSSENWTFHKLDVSRVRAFLQHLGAKHVQIICYVREQLDYIQSLWREQVKCNIAYVRPFHEFAYSMQKKLNSRISHVVQGLDDTGSLKLAWFNKNLAANHNIIQDFCSVVGICNHDYNIDEGNLSIGGNLLLFKLAKNSLLRKSAKQFRQSHAEKLAYRSNLQKLAIQRKKFQAPLFISRKCAGKFRANSVFNEYLFQKIGPTLLRDWDSERPIPDLDNLGHDLEIIFNALEPHPVPSLMEECLGLSYSMFTL